MAKDKKRILIIDDDLFLSTAYKMKFLDKGYNVKIATNGVDGFKKIKSFRPDIVFLDIRLPYKTGIEVLSEVKKDASIKNIPIIILYQLQDAEEAKVGMKMGARGCVLRGGEFIKEISRFS